MFQNRELSESNIQDVQVGIGDEVSGCRPLDPHQRRIIAATRNLAKVALQYDSMGFIASRRMYRAFNVATMHIAQSIRARFFMDTVESDLPRQKLKNSSDITTSKNTDTNEEVFREQVGWRELADISELWRIHAEPLDEVAAICCHFCLLSSSYKLPGDVG